MEKKGVRLRWSCTVERIVRTDGGSLLVTLGTGETLEVDQVLMATGRRPNTSGLGLDAVGVETNERGAIVVDDTFTTSVPSIVALGDVIDRVQLTPVALGEGMVVAHRLFGDGGRSIDYRDIPTAVFTHPNVATVGLTEAEARKTHERVRVFKSRFRPMKHTMSGRDERCFMKLVVCGTSDRVLGCHMVLSLIHI